MVWDPLVRIFHWSLAFFFFLAYLLEGDRLNLHSHAGYTVALLVVFRLIWGIIGTRHALFSGFITSLARSLLYIRQLLSGTAESYMGHNPAGAVMILALLTSLLITAFSGMSLFAMEGSGPLAGTFISAWPGHLVEEIHEFFADFTLFLVVVHIGGVLFTSLRHRENLTKAMITGRKRQDPNLPDA